MKSSLAGLFLALGLCAGAQAETFAPAPYSSPNGLLHGYWLTWNAHFKHHGHHHHNHDYGHGAHGGGGGVTAPVPEPETYAMLLAGLGVMAGVARRRGKKRDR